MTLTKTRFGFGRRSLPLFSILALTALTLNGFPASIWDRQATALPQLPNDVMVAFNGPVTAVQSNPLAGLQAGPTLLPGNTIYVTTTVQGLADDGKCSLQEAIYSANFDFGVAPSAFGSPITKYDSGCEPGSGDDTIVLAAGAEYLMTAPLNDPYNPLGPAANPVVLSNIIIEAHGARIVRANPLRDFSGTHFRAFAVAKRDFADPDDDLGVQGSGTGSLTIRNAHIKGFTAKGGNGTGGGGGGMGAGGAIYLRDAALTIESSTFNDNGAGGGNGSALGGRISGGGGGGLAGNGGRQGPIAFAGGGGGGGARGNGGDGQDGTLPGVPGDGGGGGGTLTSGGSSEAAFGGFRCGGTGGDDGLLGGEDGDTGKCPGGGGGGGQTRSGCSACLLSAGDGGNGNYGGGGGGGGYEDGDGGRGGFGGGGGAGSSLDNPFDDPDGGDGGFGGGGGAGFEEGDGGGFAGDASPDYGGGGAGLGGAIFTHGGTLKVYNSTFTSNYAVRGLGGNPGFGSGSDAGGAIFSLNSNVEVYNSTISRNETTGNFGGLVVISAYDAPVGFPLPPIPPASLTLRNTIIAVNGATSDGITYTNSTGECRIAGGSISKQGSGNLIGDNDSGGSCPGVVTTTDPLLGPLQVNAPGLTPTMALDPASPAVNAGVDLITAGITTDQRGVFRRPGSYDIGAYEILDNSVPVAVAPNPAPSTAEDTAVSMTLSGTDDDDDALTFTVTDGPDNGSLGVTVGSPVAADCTAVNSCSLSVQFTPASNYSGTDSFKFKVNDGQADSEEVTVSIVVTPVNDASLVTATPQSQPDVQYSDPILPVSISARDVETPAGSLVIATTYRKDSGSPIGGLPAGLALADNGVDGSGFRQWAVSGKADVPAGTYEVIASVTDRGDPDNVGTSSAITVPISFTIKVIRENVVVTPSTALSAVKVATPGGASPLFNLTAELVEEPDGSPGDISKAVPVTFTLNPIGGGSSPTCNNTGTTSGSALTVNCTFSNVPVGVYEVNIVVGGDYYMGGGNTVLTVYDPSLGFVSGGGWVINPNTGYRANFGVNVKYLRNGKAQGQALYIEHRPSGDVKIKSNSMQNVAILAKEAQVTAKATYQGVGNHIVILRVVDNGEPGTNDRFGLKLIDPLSRAIVDLTFINNPVLLGGGNVQVPKK